MHEYFDRLLSANEPIVREAWLRSAVMEGSTLTDSLVESRREWPSGEL